MRLFGPFLVIWMVLLLAIGCGDTVRIVQPQAQPQPPDTLAACWPPGHCGKPNHGGKDAAK